MARRICSMSRNTPCSATSATPDFFTALLIIGFLFRSNGFVPNPWERYQEEKALVWKRYPEIFGNQLRKQGAVTLYRGWQILSGRQARAMWDTAKFRGKRVTEAFGEFGALHFRAAPVAPWSSLYPKAWNG